MTKRDRRAGRREAINERLRGGGRIEVDLDDDFVPVELTRDFAPSPFADRLRYGDCGGFGAPQARRFHKEATKQ